MFAGTHTEESQIIGWVQITHSSASLGVQLLNVPSILYSSGIVHRGANRNTCRESLVCVCTCTQAGSTFLVDYNHSNHSFQALKPLERFLDLGLCAGNSLGTCNRDKQLLTIFNRKQAERC